MIEILVVLVIMGMVSGILFQALERAYRLQERFGAELFGVQQGQMATDWYRQTVHGLRPDYPDGHSLFRGEGDEFSGLTNNALGEAWGVPTQITWKIRKNQRSGGSELVYLEGGQEAHILAWHGQEARFIYVDAQLVPHDNWPPPLGPWPQLPAQIQLITSGVGEAINIVATPMGTALLVPRLQDL